MGYIRFLLAVIVVMSHSGASNYLPSLGGGGAVQAFFVISGFYMAATYTKNYAGTLGIGFIASRFTRLYPSYILILAAMFVLFMMSDSLGWNLKSEVSFSFFFLPSSIWVKASVYSMLGQDFVGQNPAIIGLLPIRQAWSISAEMAFYALTPLLLRFPRYLVLLATVIIIYKFKVLNLDHDINASYYPFYANLCFFIIGLLIFQARECLTSSKTVGDIGGMLFLIFCFSGYDASFEGPVKLGLVLTIAAICVLMPTLFEHVNTPASRLLGDLSYGIYIVHLPLIDVFHASGLTGTLARLGGTPEYASAVLTTAVIVVASAIAWVFEAAVQKPIDKARRRLFYSR